MMKMMMGRGKMMGEMKMKKSVNKEGKKDVIRKPKTMITKEGDQALTSNAIPSLCFTSHHIHIGNLKTP